MKRILLSLIATSLLFICSQAVVAQSDSISGSRTDEKQILKAVLEEIRQLRLEAQRAHTFSHRLVVTLERVRFEQSRIDSLARSAQTLRRQVEEIQATRARIETEIKESEGRLPSVPDSDTKLVLESQIKEMKTRLNALTREEEQIRNREVELNADLQGSQTKLNDLNSQLDSMMRQLQ